MEGFEPSDKCLLRATDGKQISTVVSSEDVSFRWLMQTDRELTDGLKRDNKKEGKKPKAAGRRRAHISCFHQLTAELLFFSFGFYFWPPSQVSGSPTVGVFT